MRVLIVDDSVVFRMAIKQALEEVPEVEIAGALSNGRLAVEFLQNGEKVDLVTLDMEMPILDGMETIKEIRKFNRNVPIVVFSSLTTKGAEKTIEALSNGANDFVTKEETAGANSIDKSLGMIRSRLLPIIEGFRGKKTEAFKPSEALPNRPPEDLFYMAKKPRLIVMASSTGGPEALGRVFRGLHEGQNVPILLVQHMPPVFTQKLAEMLSKVCPGYTVKEGFEGAELQPSTCYLAPGDFHMVLKKDHTIGLNQNEKVCFVRPAANCLFDSVADHYPNQVASFVLTGMGDDGAEGVRNLSVNGSYNFYQDQNSCTVFGMPGAVKKTGVAKEIPLNQIAEIINTINSRI